jgi:hypothetical protein
LGGRALEHRAVAQAFELAEARWRDFGVRLEIRLRHFESIAHAPERSQPMPCLRERQLHMPAAAFELLPAQRGARTHRHQVARRFVEDLHRQRPGLAIAERVALRMIEAHRGLHERIESATRCPRTLRAIRRERDADDARPLGSELLRTIAEIAQSAGPIALHEHMRLLHERVHRGTAFIASQIYMCGSFAAARVGDRCDVRQMRRIHEHHIGAVSRERPAAHRPREDAREVQHLDAFERTLIKCERRQLDRRRITDTLDGEQRLRRNCAALLRCIPLLERAQRRRDQLRIGHGGFEFDRVPRHQCSLRVFAFCIRRVEPEQPQCAVAVMPEVRVDSIEAVLAWVQAREGVPQIGHAAVDREPAGAFERGVVHLHAHALAGCAARVAQFAGGQSRSSDRRLRRVADGEGGWEHRVLPGEMDETQRILRQLCEPPETGEGFARAQRIS